jgi:thiol:disulfide interchange protein DsbD
MEGQACNEGTCVPLEETFTIPVDGSQYNQEKPADTIANVSDTASSALKNDSTNNSEVVASPEEKNDDGSESLWSFFWLAFISGLIAILTPCVFPMIPMTVSFFLKDGKSKAKSKIQAFVFGGSIIFIYTVVGTVLALTLGADFANFLSTHWIPNVFFFLIFMFFAASFFGMFEITLPSWVLNKTDKQAEKGGFFGAFFMAFTLVLVSFSCTGPLVGSILVLSAGGEVLKPVIGMFGFGLAFALPFALFALFPSWINNMPKSGGWLNSVKVVLGFLEVALGLKFLSIADQVYHWRILDREVYLAIWIVVFSMLGFYLLGKMKFKHDSDVKYIGVGRLGLAMITFSFVVYMIPGMWGAPLKFLSGYLPPQQTLDFDMQRIVRESSGGNLSVNPENELCEIPKFEEILPKLPHGLIGYHDFEQALQCAKEQNKPLFVDFTGHGCVNCREMEANVWSDPKVLERLNNDFIVVALYVDDKTSLPEEEWVTSSYDGNVKKTIGKKFADLQITMYNTNAQPFYVLLDTEGKDMVKPSGYDLDVDAFVKWLDEGLAEFEKRSKKE